MYRFVSGVLINVFALLG